LPPKVQVRSLRYVVLVVTAVPKAAVLVIDEVLVTGDFFVGRGD